MKWAEKGWSELQWLWLSLFTHLILSLSHNSLSQYRSLSNDISTLFIDYFTDNFWQSIITFYKPLSTIFSLFHTLCCHLNILPSLGYSAWFFDSKIWFVGLTQSCIIDSSQRVYSTCSSVLDGTCMPQFPFLFAFFPHDPFFSVTLLAFSSLFPF